MQSPLRRRIRHLRRLVAYGGLVVLILAAAVVGALNQVLPLMEQHPQKVAGWLSDRIGEPVAFTRATGEWTRRGPRFRLEGLRIGEGERTLDIGRAELLVAVYSGLLPGEPLTELKVRELSLALEQGEDGRWRMAGLPFQPVEGADPLELLEGLGELQVERARLVVRSPALDSELTLPRVDLRLRVYGDHLVAGLRAWADPAGTPVDAVADLSRGDWSGELWVGGKALRLDEWSPLLADTGLVVAGAGDVDLWARIEAQRVRDVRSRLGLAPLALGSRKPWRDRGDGRLHSPPVAFERADLLARWMADGEGWQLHAPELHFHESGRKEPHRFDGLWLAGGERYALQAPQLDLAPARALATLSDAVPPGLRRWLHEAAPDGELTGVSVSGRAGEWNGSARFEAVGWSPYGDRPGLQGLAGSAAFDQDGGVLRLGGGPARFDWPRFRQPLPVRLDGTLGWWRDGDRWTAGAAGLRVRGEDFGALVRAELQFEGDGSKPRLDLAALLDPSAIATSHKFWVVGKMPPATIEWLDNALQEGRVEQGRAVLAGDLDDWPFREREGRFDGRVRVVQARVPFNPEWPPAEALDLDVSFDGPGMALEGEGMIQGNRVRRVAGGIPDFRDPRLLLDIESPANGESLQALMLASPLRQRYEEHLLNARVRGPATVAVQLDLPLAARLGGRRIEGTIALADAQLSDPRWQIDFSRVNGSARFSDTGFAAEELDVEFEGKPARFNLRVGADYTGDPALAASADLVGTMPAAALLARHPPLGWLQEWLQGDSDWRIGVQVPVAPAGQPSPPARLEVRSDLVGTTISLPAPLGKAAGTPMALQLDAPLPVGGGEVRLRLGEDMRLRGRMDARHQGMTGLIQFGAGPELPLPADGLVVRGTTPTLDAAGWIAFAARDGSAGTPTPAGAPAASAGGASALREVDLQVASLDLLGSPFADTRVQLRREPLMTRLQLTGPAIAGSVEVPTPVSLGIQGRFERLHWPEKPEPTPEQLALADTGASEDPTKLPPLRFSTEDLRVGKLALGRAELVAVPVAGALRIEKFDTRSPSLELSASGDWQATGEGSSRSLFAVEFKAASLGEVLDAFGLAGMVEDGETQGRLDGSWPGSPGAFSLARFTGRMKVEVGEGQLLEVEPGGGGRMLGLISLAEIPRRLTLDFKDFFQKGFGFNTMAGEFEFANGRASTDRLQINGPAAEIRVSGSTDLRRQEYDQRIEVLPKAGGVLPALGAVVGGPVGAAVGAVAQAVLQQPLKQAARTVYRVTGPWKDPKVEVVEKGPAQGDRREVAEREP